MSTQLQNLSCNELNWFALDVASGRIEKSFPCRCGALHGEGDKADYEAHQVLAPAMSAKARALREMLANIVANWETVRNSAAWEEFQEACAFSHHDWQDSELTELATSIEWTFLDLERGYITTAGLLSSLKQLCAEPELVWQHKPITLEPGEFTMQRYEKKESA